MKNVLILFSFTLVSWSLRAQTAETHFGIKAGFNISGLDVEGARDYDAKAGFHMGAFAHLHVTPHFGLQPELVFSTQGGKDRGDKWRINYLNVPILFQFMTGTGFRLQTGPQLGFAVNSEYKTGAIEYDNGEDVNLFDLSWSFGFSYMVPSGLGVDARYNHGITNIYDPEVPEVRNRVFQLGVFYQFMNTTHRGRR